MSEEDTETGTETTDLSWDSLRAAWEQGGLSPAQVQGRLEASRKWEQRAKAAPSGDELTSLREKAARADALANDLATDTERAAREARENTEKELRPQLQSQAVEDAFRLLIGDSKTDDETNDFLADLNLTRFIGENGRVDTAKVRARAAQFAPATGTSTTSTKGPTVTGHGSRGGKPSTLAGATSGSELFDRIHPKKTA